jgi:hypothetical protein
VNTYFQKSPVPPKRNTPASLKRGDTCIFDLATACSLRWCSSSPPQQADGLALWLLAWWRASSTERCPRGVARERPAPGTQRRLAPSNVGFRWLNSGRPWLQTRCGIIDGVWSARFGQGSAPMLAQTMPLVVDRSGPHLRS